MELTPDWQALWFYKVVQEPGVLPSCFFAIPQASGLLSLITAQLQAHLCSCLWEAEREHASGGRVPFKAEAWEKHASLPHICHWQKLNHISRPKHKSI